MVNKLVHFSDLHIRLFKDHDLYRGILTDMFNQFREIKPDRIVFTGDLVHSKNQMTPESLLLGYYQNVLRLPKQFLLLVITISWKTICQDWMR